MVDANGDLISLTSPTDNGGGGFFSGSEAVAVALQAASNASLYSIRLSFIYEGARSHKNALNEVRVSSQDSIVYHAKDEAHNSMRARIPSPLKALLLPGSKTPYVSDARIVAWMTAWDNAWNGTYGGVSLRFSERGEINPRVQV
jgi:hypothetical protein